MYYIYTLLIPLSFALTTGIVTPAKAEITQTVGSSYDKAQIQDVRHWRHREHYRSYPHWKKQYPPPHRHHYRRHFFHWRFY